MFWNKRVAQARGWVLLRSTKGGQLATRLVWKGHVQRSSAGKPTWHVWTRSRPLLRTAPVVVVVARIFFFSEKWIYLKERWSVNRSAVIASWRCTVKKGAGQAIRACCQERCQKVGGQLGIVRRACLAHRRRKSCGQFLGESGRFEMERR